VQQLLAKVNHGIASAIPLLALEPGTRHLLGLNSGSVQAIALQKSMSGKELTLILCLAIDALALVRSES